MCLKPVSKTHFEPPFDFLDLFLPVNASSASRARAFLWLMFHYLESPSVHNPFSDDYADQHPGRIPRLEMLAPEQRTLENVDTEEEMQYGRRMAQYRSKFLQKQIADEDKEKNGFGIDGVVKRMEACAQIGAFSTYVTFLDSELQNHNS
jgi:Ino eighty subunit 1